MARTSKSRGATPFNMRSGKGTKFKTMGSSPVRVDPTDTDTKTDTDINTPYVRGEDTIKPKIESFGSGARNEDTSTIASGGEGTFSTPALDNLLNVIENTKNKEIRSGAITHYKKKYEEMQALLKSKN